MDKTQSYSFSDNKLGYSAIIIALIGIFIALFQAQITEAYFPQQETSILEQTVDIITNKETTKNQPISVSAIFKGFGFLALILAVFSFIQRNDRTISMFAGGLSILVIGWEYIFIALILVIVLYFTWNFFLDW